MSVSQRSANDNIAQTSAYAVDMHLRRRNTYDSFIQQANFQAPICETLCELVFITLHSHNLALINVITNYKFSINFTYSKYNAYFYQKPMPNIPMAIFISRFQIQIYGHKTQTLREMKDQPFQIIVEIWREQSVLSDRVSRDIQHRWATVYSCRGSTITCKKLPIYFKKTHNVSRDVTTTAVSN